MVKGFATLRNCLMGKHIASCNITYGIDMRYAGLHVSVHFYAFWHRRDAYFTEIHRIRIGPAPHSDKDLVSTDRLAPPFQVISDLKAAFSSLYGLHHSLVDDSHTEF